MTILVDNEIEELCLANPPLIYPYNPEQVRVIKKDAKKETWSIVKELFNNPSEAMLRKVISFGMSSMGYDVTLAREIRIFTNANASIIDPKLFREDCLIEGKILNDGNGEYTILPPNSYLLGHTVETFVVPRNLLILAVGKSTYARAGVIVNVTPIEPGFEGNVVIEISNSTPLPVKIYINEGIAQFLFFQSSEPCKTSYGDRKGKYQGQTGLTLPRV